MLQIVDNHTKPTQLELEARMVDLGAARYRTKVAKDRARDQAAATGGLAKVVTNIVPALAVSIEEWREGIANSGRGRNALAYSKTKGLEAELLAFIAARIVFDRIMGRGGATLVRTGADIGRTVETEMRLHAFAAGNKKLLAAALEKIADRSANVDHRRTALVHLMNTKGDKWDAWTDKARVQVGALLIEKLVGLGSFIEIYDGVGHRQFKGEKRLRATPAALTWAAQADDADELLQPVVLPCIEKPLDWTSPTQGGYHSEELRGMSPVIRSYHRRDRLAQLEKADLSHVFRALNAAQATEWKINGRVLDVMREVWERGLDDLSVLPKRDLFPLPAKPYDIDINPDALRDWKRVAAATHTANAKSVSRRLNVTRTLTVANDFARHGGLHFVYQCDFRGRMYAIGQGPNPQGADYQVGLLTFRNGKPIGEGSGPGWLAIHGANCFGVDKVSLEDRIDWIEQHRDRISACALDPLSNLWWTEADSPWRFLSFCFEWSDYLKQGPSFVTHLPIMVDGTCNGLQHYSAMLRDPVGGAATNLLPSSRPQDIYGRVAEVVVGKDPNLAGIVTRSITKRPVMVLPYGGTFNSCKDYVGAALKDAGHDIERDEVTRIATLVWSSIGDVVVAARDGMAFIRKLASAASKKKQHVSWVTPSGWPVLQQYFDTKFAQVNCLLFNKRTQLRVPQADLKTLEARRSGQGLPPNFVHSLDASAMVLMMGLALDQPEPIAQFAVVHDSFGTLAPDTDLLGGCIRHAFCDMYEDHDVLAELRQSVADAIGPRAAAFLPAVPVKGSLDIKAVLSSDFFFA